MHSETSRVYVILLKEELGEKNNANHDNHIKQQ